MSRPTQLAVYMDGGAAPAGFLVSTEDQAIAFGYDQDYIAGGGPPLSLSMPLEQRAFSDVAARAFFGNLLPENDQMQRVMDREGLDRDDVVGLLAQLGADCSGAISCLPLDAPPVKVPGVLAEDYETIPPGELAEIVASLADHRRLPDAAGDPSPVAGVQRKIALVHTTAGYARPKPGLKVPTTHILKVPERRLWRDAGLEEQAARLARAVGLEVSIPQAVRIGDVHALLITRFDRVERDGVVYRVHQEDFAQALGLPSRLKYQRNGDPGRRFDAEAIARVLDQTERPALARQAFLAATLFNLLIGNTDNHAKNHGLLYASGRAPAFAPLYDLLPSQLNQDFTDQLSFDIGKAEHPDAVTRDDLLEFLAAFGMTKAAAGRFLERTARPMVQALEAATLDLAPRGFKDLDDLIGRETEQLVETLSLDVKVRERDFVPKGRYALGAS